MSRVTRKAGQVRGRDRPGSPVSMEACRRLGEVSGRKACWRWLPPVWVSLGMLTGGRSSLRSSAGTVLFTWFCLLC